MSRIHETLALIDDPDAPPLSGEDPADQALHSLLVHLAFSDGVVHEDELALLRRVRPEADDEDLMAWVMQVCRVPMDWDAVKEACPEREDRVACQRFATRMACMDGEIAEEEEAALARLCTRMELPPDAWKVCLDEVLAVGVTIDAKRVTRALQSMQWKSLLPERGGVEGPLAEHVPADASPLARMLDDDEEEIAGLYLEGLVARFKGGPGFVRWTQIDTYTRCPVPGASTHLMMEDGSKHSLPMGSPLADVAHLLDLVTGRAELIGR